jgi:hypothetical protein
MFFIILVFLSAFLIEGIGTYVSVIGLSALFAANPIIITMAVALDLGKVVAVSFVYKYWAKISALMKTYMTTAALVLMMITSAGVFGFLSGEFQKAISHTNSQSVVLQALTDEQSRLQKRKEEIDKQIASLPDKFSASQRIRMINQFKDEQKQVTVRLAEIDKQLPALKVEAIKKNVEVGPILYVAQAFNTTPEEAVKWLILVIIFVFDPLAISLLLAGNFLVEQRKKPADLPKLKLPEDVPAKEQVSSFSQETMPLSTALDTLEPAKHGGEFPDTLVDDDSALYSHEPREPIYEVLTPSTVEDPPKQEATPATVVAETVTKKEVSNEVPQDEPNVRDDGASDSVVDDPEPVRPTAEEREVITLEQVQKPIVRKSSLDSIDPRSGDVIIDGDDDTRQIRSLRQMYEGETVSVGGPSGRPASR